MKKKIFVIWDRDKGYVERFCRYLERCPKPLEVRGFTSEEALDAFLQTARPEFLLAGEALAGTKLWQRAREVCLIPLLLSEASEQLEAGYVYRYQSAEQILRQALAAYEESVDPEGTAAGQATVYGVYSPVKRCYKTTFALILGQLLAEQGPTLYVNLEDNAGLALWGGPEAGGLSDVLYDFKIKKGAVRLERVVRSLGALSCLPPVVCPGDIRETAPEELAGLIGAAAARGEYAALVLDVGDALRDPLQVLRLCRRIYMPMRGDAISQARVEAFTRSFPEGAERLCQLSLPDYEVMGNCLSEGSCLLQSPMGNYLRTWWQEERTWRA